ncbi:hypothetical protein ABBQ32_007204 [Trebouxia sp. C0010 RCD-2024]
MWHRALVRCQAQTSRTCTPSCRTHILPYSQFDSTQGAQASLSSRRDVNCSSWNLLSSGFFHTSPAWSAAARDKPSHPEIPGSNLKPATPSSKASSGNPAGWGDPVKELSGTAQGKAKTPGQSPAPSGAEDHQRGLQAETPQASSGAQHVPPPPPGDLKSWAAQDIPENAPQHQMPGVPGDLIPPGIPPQFPQDPGSEVPPAVDPDRVLSQATNMQLEESNMWCCHCHTHTALGISPAHYQAVSPC